jgi:hypothetical protein
LAYRARVLGKYRFLSPLTRWQGDVILWDYYSIFCQRYLTPSERLNIRVISNLILLTYHVNMIPPQRSLKNTFCPPPGC